jgi:multidrug efflux system membrane fusion protein
MDFFRGYANLCQTLLLIAIVSIVATLSGCASEAKVTAAPKPAIVAHPSSASLAVEVYSGAVHARYESVLGFRVAGKIKTRNVDVGARVKSGALLAVLDPQDAELALAAARAQSAWSKADLSLAKAEMDRHQSMLDKKLISQSLYDAKVNAYKAAEARAKQADAQLSVSQNQSKYSELRADADGVITQVTAEPGQVVAAGQPVVALARDGAREVLINVPEGRVEAFKPGTEVLADLWAKDGSRYNGTVREVAPEADAASRTYNVRVTLTNADPSVHLGMTARVYLPSASGASFNVPLAALTAKNGTPALWKVDAKTGEVRLQPVKIGQYAETGVSVFEGLTSEDWIVTAGVHKLVEGQVIKPVDFAMKPVDLASR